MILNTNAGIFSRKGSHVTRSSSHTALPIGPRRVGCSYCETSIFEVLVNDNVTGEMKGMFNG